MKRWTVFFFLNLKYFVCFDIDVEIENVEYK